MEVWWLLQPARNSSRWSWAKNTPLLIRTVISKDFLKTQWWASSPFNMVQFPLSGGIWRGWALRFTWLRFTMLIQDIQVAIQLQVSVGCRSARFSSASILSHVSPRWFTVILPIICFPTKCKTLTFGVGPFVLPPVESTTSVFFDSDSQTKMTLNF